MTIEFECGVTATNVAMPGMAARAHTGQCENAACQQDVKQAAEKYKNVLID
jgi:hypothetical protein